MFTSIIDPSLAGCSDLEVLVGVNDAQISQQIVDTLLELDCKVYPARDPQDAMSKLQFHSFPVVILQEGYSMEMMQILACLPMSIRRNIFYVMIGNNLETGNAMHSFVLSTNFVLNVKDVGNFGKIFKNALLNNNRFYRPFYQSMEKITKERNS